MSTAKSPSRHIDPLPQRKFVRMSQKVEYFSDRSKSTTTPTSTNGTLELNNRRRRPVVFVIYYSTYGHVAKMAMSICVGIQNSGCECRIFQVAETLSEDVLSKMHAAPKDRSIPIIRAEQLVEADGFLFGMPTRFGSVPTQMKNLFDACGSHWQSDALIGKPAGVFFSTATLGGGQETTALSCIPFFTHLGMIFVPLGYKNKSLVNLDEVHGGSPYGAGTLAGIRGERKPSSLELHLAETQGKEFAKLVQKLTHLST